MTARFEAFRRSCCSSNCAPSAWCVENAAQVPFHLLHPPTFSADEFGLLPSRTLLLRHTWLNWNACPRAAPDPCSYLPRKRPDTVGEVGRAEVGGILRQVQS